MQVSNGVSQPGGAGESYGRALLERMGWTAGTGLGAERNGMVNPLTVKSRVEKLGVGAQRDRPFADSWWETMMVDAYGKGKLAGDDDLLAACEGRRCRPHGIAKLDRVAAADRSLADGGMRELVDGIGGKEKNGGPEIVCERKEVDGSNAAAKSAERLERRREKEDRRKRREQRRIRKTMKADKRREKELKRLKNEEKRKAA